MRPVIIAIVGPSGSGKTTLAEYLRTQHGIPAIISTTTRPKRPNEVEGLDYFFLTDTTIILRPQDILTKTRFAGYEYFATKSQLPQSGLCTYIVDERGVRKLKRSAGKEYGIITVMVRCDTDKLLERGIDPERIERDRNRKKLNHKYLDLIVSSNGTKEEFKRNIDGIYKIIEQWLPLL
jgi:guanylate kinase